MNEKQKFYNWIRSEQSMGYLSIRHIMDGTTPVDGGDAGKLKCIELLISMTEKRVAENPRELVGGKAVLKCFTEEK